MSDWFKISDPEDVPSPALLVYPARIEENLRRIIKMVGDVNRLRPHIKTHKTAELIRMQLAHGISKFKCATIAEAEMAAIAGARDILLAYQPVGPNIERLLTLIIDFPEVRFSCVADNADSLQSISAAARQIDFNRRIETGLLTEAAVAGQGVEVLIDVDVGQHRTGIDPHAALKLYQLLAALPALRAGGLHAYDGHISDSDIEQRKAACEAAFAPVEVLRRKLEREGLPMPRVIVGGTPTFPMHARREGVECSPGTCVLWDAGYARKLPDMDFLPAAVLLTRVISKPTSTRICLDLGHKAVASEMPHSRVVFLNLDDSTAVGHSEEHLVLETPHAESLAVGDCLYGIPWHICPTVALHSEMVVVRNAHAEGRWKVAARDRSLTI